MAFEDSFVVPPKTQIYLGDVRIEKEDLDALQERAPKRKYDGVIDKNLDRAEALGDDLFQTLAGLGASDGGGGVDEETLDEVLIKIAGDYDQIWAALLTVQSILSARKTEENMKEEK